jgi:hypothetical protein
MWKKFLRWRDTVPSYARDIILIVTGLLLGTATQYLSTHIWFILNTAVSGLWHDTWSSACANIAIYWEASKVGVWVEVIAIIIAILILVFIFKDKDNKELRDINESLKHNTEVLERIEKKLGKD